MHQRSAQKTQVIVTLLEAVIVLIIALNLYNHFNCSAVEKFVSPQC